MNIKTIVVGYLNENCYILEKDNKCIVIDPGDEVEKIKENINCEVIAILITHNHFDHVGALSVLEQIYDVPVYDYNNVSNEMNIDIFNFKTIKTPGHTFDSISYYFNEDNVMFVGDFIFKGSIGRTDLGGNDSDMQKSINKIISYNDDIILYPGHGNKTTLGYEKINNMYIRRYL